MIGHPPKHLDTINHDRQVNCTLCRVTQFHGREAEGCERRNHPGFCFVCYFWSNTLRFWTVNTWLMNSSDMTWTAPNIVLLILPVCNIPEQSGPAQRTAHEQVQLWAFRVPPFWHCNGHSCIQKKKENIERQFKDSHVKSQRRAFIMSSSWFFWNSNLCKNMNFSLLTCIHVNFVLVLHCSSNNNL